MPHPYRDVVIAGVHNTAQARHLEGHDSESITFEAALGALADAGVEAREGDAVIGAHAQELVLGLRLGPCTRLPWQLGIPIALEAADLAASPRAGAGLIAARRGALSTA